MAVTTGSVAVNYGIPVKPKKKKKKKNTILQIPVMQKTLTAAELVDTAICELLEQAKKKPHTMTGGKDFLAALFARGVLKTPVGKRKKGQKSVQYKGYKGRTYTVTKLGGGKYKVQRQK